MKEVSLILPNQLFIDHNKDLNFRFIKKEVKYEDWYYHTFSDREHPFRRSEA
jgi:hypothetical protein